MNDVPSPWVPRDVLWEIGTSFIDATNATAGPVIEAALARVAVLLDASSVGVWRVDETTLRGVNLHSWSSSPDVAEVHEAVVAPDPSVRDAVQAGDGIAMVELHQVLGSELCEERGWHDGAAMVALIDQTAEQTSVLVVTSTEPEWGELERELLQGAVLLLRQFNTRLRVEERLTRRHRLDDLTVRVAAQLLAVDLDTAERAVEGVLAELREILAAESVALIDVVDDHTLALPHVVAGATFPSDLHTLEVADVSKIPGAEGLSLRELIREPRQLDVVTVVDALMGEEFTDSFGLRSQDRTVAILPASATEGDATLAVTRVGGVGWVDDDVDVLTTIASLIAQTRGRVDAQSSSRERLAVQRALAATGQLFLEAGAADAPAAIHQTIDLMARQLDADLAVIAEVADDGSVHIVDSWAKGVDLAVAPGSVIERASTDLIDQLMTNRTAVSVRDSTEDLAPRLRDSADGKWTTVVAPIRGAGLPTAALTFVWARGGLQHLDHAHELANATADLIGQLNVRLRHERLGARRLDAQRLLSRCAAELAESTPNDFASVLEGLLARVGEFCGLAAILDLVVDRRNGRYLRSGFWVRPEFEDLALAESIEFGSSTLLDTVRTTGGSSSRTTDEPTVELPDRFAVARGEAGGVERILLAASLEPGGWGRDVRELLESVSGMVHQVDVRIGAQRYAQAAFQGAPIGVVLRDEDLRLITCNRSFVEFVGADSVDELVGTMPDFVFDEPVESIEWSEDQDGQFRSEAVFRGPGGTRVWGQLRVSLVAGDHGEHFWLVHVEDITERRRAELLLRFQATHDELTGLANRRQLLEEIQKVASGSESVAVLLLDLDRFKNVNDSLGHDRGDELLVVVADRLRLAVRPGDLVARLGGDEFAVVLPGPVDATDAEVVAERLMRLIGDPVTLGHQKIYPTASIGIAVADAGAETAVADLLRRADTAMYRAKAQGRARAELFDEDLRDAVTARMATESGLRGALLSGELRVHYQPEVSLPDRSVLGAEALVRWEHPEKGMLAAGAFIEVAEETGLIVEIGEMVLAEAVREAAGWDGPCPAPLLRVNLAAAQLQRDDTVELVRAALARTGLDPGRLCLEITESAVMGDVQRSEDVLHQLKAIGVRLAVDDFGTGFSSLAYLKRFPVDTLKIDRTFVGDLDRSAEDVAFVRAIISLAEALDLEVVAEGVETESQAEILVELGCHRAQGFLFAPPQPATTVRELLA